MLVVGVDPGTAITGYGLVRQLGGRQVELVDYGVIRTPSDRPMAERLRQLYHDLHDVVAEHQPDEAAVEELFFSRNVTTALTVGQARGVAMLAAAEAGLPVHEYKPAEIKQAVVGYGNASKEQVQEMVRVLLGIAEVPRPDDAADAVAVAICHIHSAPFDNFVG
ncbi:MAG: Crossover junction endodeoxyribonuclease RuvC [Anaerolineales bacterium]|nr:Crossover junction endodeoxyribonuclease RuvC [Anaerolineales bacterium]